MFTNKYKCFSLLSTKSTIARHHSDKPAILSFHDIKLSSGKWRHTFSTIYLPNLLKFP